MEDTVKFKQTWKRTTVLALAVFVVAVAAATAQDEQQEVNERFLARAVVMGISNPPVIPPGSTATIDIVITRWTTDEERDFLFDTLAENGQRQLVRELRRQDETGWIRVTGPSGRGTRTTTAPSERLRFARQIPLDGGGRRIILALDRPISMYEATTRPRWRNHDVTVFFIDLDAENVGTGQLAIGVQLEVDTETNTLTVANFGSEPVRLTSVRPRN